MTSGEAIAELKRDIELDNDFTEDYLNAVNMAIKALEQQLCQDAISREMALDCDMSIRLNKSVITQYPVGEYDYLSLRRACFHGIELAKHEMENYLIDLPSVTPQPKIGHCKDCKFFEYDSVAKVNGIPLIVAHEICSRWGDGCKTKEDGYCFLFEPKMQEVEE